MIDNVIPKEFKNNINQESNLTEWLNNLTERKTSELKKNINYIYSICNKIEYFLDMTTNINKFFILRQQEVETDLINSYQNYYEKLKRQIDEVKDIDKISDRISFLVKDSDNLKFTHEKRVKDLESLYKTIQQNTDKIKNNYENLLSSFIQTEGQIINIKGETTELNSNISQIGSKITEEIEKNEQLIKTSYSNRIENFLHEVTSQKNRLDEEIITIDKAIEGYKELISDRATEKMTSVYLNKANNERNIYYGFTILSLVIISCAIGLSWDSLNDFINQSHQLQLPATTQSKTINADTSSVYTTPNLQYLGLRLIFSFIIFSTVIYTTRIASRAYHHWKKNEAMFLKLTALKPFIIEMSKEKKIEIHEKLVDVYFGKDESPDTNAKIRDLPNNLTQLLGKVVENASSFVDGVNGKAKEPEKSEDKDKDKDE